MSLLGDTLRLQVANNYGAFVSLGEGLPEESRSQLLWFGVGCLLAICKESQSGLHIWLGARMRAVRTTSLLSYVHRVLPLAGISLIAAAIYLFDRETLFPGWAALVPTLGAACLRERHGVAAAALMIMPGGWKNRPLVVLMGVSGPGHQRT